MSEDHSVSPAAESTDAKKEAGYVNANATLQKALQKLSLQDKGSIILRCDVLPFVRGSEEDFETVFSTLLQIFLQQKNDVAKLFLHIHCTAEDDQVTAGGIKPFVVLFNTNLSPCGNWLQLHEKQINDVTALLQKYQGHFVVNQVKNGGCIFSVLIFGKLSL